MRILDLFCGAGGAAMGLHKAGFDIVGVDIEPQPNYPFEFHQADAITYPTEGFDAYWASPPCQCYSWAAKRWGKEWPDLVDPTRQKLIATGKHYIIENVVGAPLQHHIWLEGTMFGLSVIRRRLFETSFPCMMPGNHTKKGSVKTGEYCTVAGHGGDGKASLDAWQKAMGIDWMTKYELTQAIPPAYSEYLGRQLQQYLVT